MADTGLVFRIPHLPAQLVHVALFRDVKNSAFLRQQLIEGNAAFEYAFVDASSIISINHILAACFRAINDMTKNRLKSRNVHSEIVFALSLNNNIAESFRRFGLTDKTTNLFAIKVMAAEASEASEAEQSSVVSGVGSHLKSSVEGVPVPVTDEELSKFSDLDKIRKTYKIPASSKSTGNTQIKSAAPSAAQLETLQSIILGSMAIRGS